MTFSFVRHIGRLFGYLMLLIIGWPLSQQCSTCLEERCYDNGECIIGCEPGYVGRYCAKICPSHCLKKTCHFHIHSGAVTCTDGCEPGYCDIKCELPCPEDCSTCDRECGSCNVTLCPARRYGSDCREICSPKYGKCDRETGECIRCIRGYYGDTCTNKCMACFTREDDIRDSCLSGCERCKSSDTCPIGSYGDSCELQCSPGCDKPGRCNRATGECSTGCVSGYHGLSCNFTCNIFCVGGICNQHNGMCTNGCTSGYKSNLDTCEIQANEQSNLGCTIGVISLLILQLCVAALVVFIWRMRFNKYNRQSERGRSDRLDGTDDRRAKLYGMERPAEGGRHATGDDTEVG